MKPEKRHLIHDLLDDQPAARREATLMAGGRILRWRRRRRVAVQCLAVLAIVGVVALSLDKIKTPPTPPVAIATPPPPAQKGELTDEQLLALFPKTPVGLATLENGKKRLIFPHPGDEERLITHL